MVVHTPTSKLNNVPIALLTTTLLAVRRAAPQFHPASTLLRLELCTLALQNAAKQPSVTGVTMDVLSVQTVISVPKRASSTGGKTVALVVPTALPEFSTFAQLVPLESWKGQFLKLMVALRVHLDTTAPLELNTSCFHLAPLEPIALPALTRLHALLAQPDQISSAKLLVIAPPVLQEPLAVQETLLVVPHAI